MRDHERERRVGFTLLELVVVLGILVILASMIAAKMDVLTDKANLSVGSANISGVGRFVQTYRTLKNTFPDNWDSLLVTTTRTLSTNLEPALNGIVVGNPRLVTYALAGSGKELLSLSRVGISIVYDEDTTGTDPIIANRWTTTHALAATDAMASLNATTSAGQKIVNAFYGTTLVPIDKETVVVGVGRKNDMMNVLLQEIPTWSATNHRKYYNRLLVVFELDKAGGPAHLLGSIGADGTFLADAIEQFQR